jgi:hypothetical protein
VQVHVLPPSLGRSTIVLRIKNPVTSSVVIQLTLTYKTVTTLFVLSNNILTLVA